MDAIIDTMSQDMAGSSTSLNPEGGAREQSRTPALGFFVNNGWIKLHRIIKDKAYYRKPHYLALWIHLLLSVNHEEREFLWNGKIITVKAGQLITGRLTLSDDTGIPASNVERILKMLENEHQIEQQKTNKYRLITIKNWSKYQTLDTKTDSKRTTDGQQVDTNKKLKNVRMKEITSTANAGNDINHLIGLFKGINPSIEKLFGRPPQRSACERLITTHGVDKVTKVISFIEKRRGDRFCPTITTPIQLEEKWGALEAYAMKLSQTINKNKIVEI